MEPTEMVAATSPSTDNYYVGKGRCYFKADGESTFRHMGNAAEVEWTAEIDKLEHFSSMEGVRTKDKTIVREKSATLRLVLEEWNAENLKLALLGEVSEGSGGDKIIDIYSVSEIAGEFKFEGSNDVGPKQFIHLFNVSFQPSGGLGLISDEFGQIELTADVLTNDAGRFGDWQVI